MVGTGRGTPLTSAMNTQGKRHVSAETNYI